MNKKYPTFGLFCLVLIMPLSLHAGVYKCTDADGGKSFSSRPCDANAVKKEIYENKAMQNQKANTKPSRSRYYGELSGIEKSLFNEVQRGAEKDDIIKVNEILSKNAHSIHARDKNGQTVLHIASRAAKLNTVKALIDAGADVNSVNNFGKTPLFLAAEVGENAKPNRYALAGDIARLLVKHGAKVKIKNKHGTSLFFSALFHGNAHVTKLALDGGISVDDLSKTGTTAMYEGAWTKHINVLELLLNYGAKINQKNRDGKTAMDGAAWTNSVKVATFLLANGATLIKKGKTPLHLAAQHGQIEISEWLIKQGVSINAKADIGSPLHQAAWTGRADYIQWFMKNRPKINSKRSSDGNTPLHVAAFAGKADAVRMLLKHGANKRIKNKAGKTAKDLATDRKYWNVANALR